MLLSEHVRKPPVRDFFPENLMAVDATKRTDEGVEHTLFDGRLGFWNGFSRIRH